MIGQWYYGRGSDITGPVTGRELFDLANGGTIHFTDTVWQEGNDVGVAAGTVINLFPDEAAGDVALAFTVGDAPAVLPLTLVIAPVVAPIETPAAELGGYPVKTDKKARATAGKGAVIVGQDGKTVKFRL